MFKEYVTYAGVSISDELWNELAYLYPAHAYSEVGGASYLTDINNGQIIRRLWKVFGPRGIGWGLRVGPLGSTNMNTGDSYEAVINEAYFWYLGVDEEGNTEKFKILTSGASSNRDGGYAMSGAMTGCIKKAISYLGHQNALYCGAFKHGNVPSDRTTGQFVSLVEEAKKLGGEENNG